MSSKRCFKLFMSAVIILPLILASNAMAQDEKGEKKEESRSTGGFTEQGFKGAGGLNNSSAGAPGSRPGGRASAESGRKDKASFVELLDSKDLSHFRGYQTEEVGDSWSIDGKHLVFDGEGSGDIITKETYGDFELQVEWKIEEGGNSGIMYHVQLGDDQPYKTGPEIQILDDAGHADGKSELTSAGALYGLYPATEKKLRPAGIWNKSRLIIEDNKLTHYLNGAKVVEAEIGSDDWNQKLAESKFKDWEKFAKSSTGHICFQNHGDPVRFRNIRIKRLDGSQDENAVAGRGRGGFQEMGLKGSGGLNTGGRGGAPNRGGNTDAKKKNSKGDGPDGSSGRGEGPPPEFEGNEGRPNLPEHGDDDDDGK